MIDLRQKALPTTVTVKGRAFEIYTDYRVWLEVAEILKKSVYTQRELTFVFVSEIPDCDFVVELMQFYANPNATPRDMGDSSTDTLYDYILDGEYIYASFLSEYGIDLIETDMHWWKFKALFTGLSEKSKMKEIMGFRGYTKSKDKSIDETYKRLKRAWSLDSIISAEEQEALDEFNSL